VQTCALPILRWRVGIRNGDTPPAVLQQQKKYPPEVLIITPESLHLLLAQKNYPEFFATLKIIAVDEWHELLGSKRGVQVELAISRLVALRASGTYHLPLTAPPLICGISATIGKLIEAAAVFHASISMHAWPVIVRAELKKNIEIGSVFPDEIEKYPWAGPLGIKL